jgi:hypothetical protein
MANQEPSNVQNRRTSDAARELGLQPDAFLRLAAEAGLTPGKMGRHYLWSDT